jgi:hypothetical protein
MAPNISLQRTAPCGLAAELRSLCAQGQRLRKARGLPGRETRHSARVMLPPLEAKELL